MLKLIKRELGRGRTLLQFGLVKSIGQVMGMIAPLAIAKFFSPELFGSYSLAKMIVFFFSAMLIASSQVPFIVFASQERAESGKLNKAFTVQCLFLILSFCIFAVIILLLSKYFIAFAKISRGDLYILLPVFVGLALKTFLCNLFLAIGQKIRSSLAELLFGFLNLVLIFLFYFLDMINLKTVFLVYPLSAGILILVFVRAIDFKILLPLRLEKKQFADMVDFTKWVFLGATAVYFIDWGDNLVLRYFVPVADIGIYNLGYQIFKGIVILIGILGAYFLPFISQNIDNPTKIKEYFLRKRLEILLGGIIAITIIFSLLPYVLNMIYGEIYQESAAVLRILLIAAALSLYNVFYIPVFNASKRYKFFYTANVLQVLSNVIMNVLFIPAFGILGAAIATVLAYLLRGIIIETYFRLKLRKILKI